MASEICMMCRPFLGTTGFNPDCTWHGTKAQERNTRLAPAATDTGLVTVETQWRLIDRLRPDRPWGAGPTPDWASGVYSETRELVTRSQAEELLAAKDKEIASLIPRAPNCGRYLAECNDGRLLYLNHANTWQECPNFIETKNNLIQSLIDLDSDEVKRLEADNAAKDARIKELEADRDHQSKLSNKLNRSHAALEARLAAAHEALEFYANTDNWKNGRFEQAEGGTVLQHYPSSAHKDRGATARAVLGGKPT